MLAGFVLILSVIVCATAARVWLRKTNETRPVFQPQDAAFLIWFLLFALGIAQGVMTTMQGSGSPSVATLLYAMSFLVCALWVPLYFRRWYVACAVVLSAAWACVFASVVVFDRDETTALLPWTHRTILYRIGPGMLLGWVSLATLLSLVYAGEGRLNRPETLVVASAVASAIALATRQPYVCLPVLWACLLHNEIPSAAANATLVGVVGVLGGSARLWWES